MVGKRIDSTKARGLGVGVKWSRRGSRDVDTDNSRQRKWILTLKPGHNVPWYKCATHVWAASPRAGRFIHVTPLRVTQYDKYLLTFWQKCNTPRVSSKYLLTHSQLGTMAFFPRCHNLIEWTCYYSFYSDTLTRKQLGVCVLRLTPHVNE